MNDQTPPTRPETGPASITLPANPMPGSGSPGSGTLVPLRPRGDGWSPARQRLFLETLADTGCVTDAAEMVGMSTASAYRLRRRAGAEAFTRAWDSAIAHAIRRLTDIALERAIRGVSVPVIHGGEIVAERRVYSDRLLTFLMKHHNPAIYGTPTNYNPVMPKDRLTRAAKLFGDYVLEVGPEGEDWENDAEENF
jgi:hypothetical protein